LSGFDIVDHNGVEGRARKLAIYEDHGDVNRISQCCNVSFVIAGWSEKDSRHALFAEDPEKIDFLVHVIVTVCHDDEIARLARSLLDHSDERGEEGIGDITHNDADRFRLATTKTSSGPMRRVAERSDRILDEFETFR